MKIKFPPISFRDLELKAQDIIFDVLEDTLPEDEIVNRAVPRLVKFLDDQISYGNGPVAKLVDSVDHHVMTWLLRLVVQKVFRELADAEVFDDLSDEEGGAVH